MKNKGKKCSVSTQMKKKAQNYKENIPFSPFKNKTSKKIVNDNNEPITSSSLSNTKKGQRTISLKSKISSNKDNPGLISSSNNALCIENTSSYPKNDSLKQNEPKIIIKHLESGSNYSCMVAKYQQSTEDKSKALSKFQKLPYRQKYWQNRHSSIFKIQSLPICYRQSSCSFDLSEQIQVSQQNYKCTWKEEKKDIEQQISQLTLKLRTAKQNADKDIEQLRYNMNDHLLSTINNYQIQKKQLITQKEGLQKISSEQKDKINQLSSQLESFDMENKNLKAKAKILEINQGLFKEKIQQLTERQKLSSTNQASLRKIISEYQLECSKIKEQKKILKEKATDLIKLIQELKNEQIN